MKNYWISVDMSPQKNEYRTKVEREIVEEAEHKLIKFLGFEKDQDKLFFKTSDEDEMEDTVIEAAWITERYLTEVCERDSYGSFISMYAQPYCSQCGQLGEFSDNFCSQCGEKLVPKQDFEFTKIKLCS